MPKTPDAEALRKAKEAKEAARKAKIAARKVRDAHDRPITEALVQRAIDIIGSQKALGRLLGISQQGVSYFLMRAPRVTGEMARAIERATKGKVNRKQLRPDIFGGMKAVPSKRTTGKRTASPVVTGGAPAPNAPV